MKYLLAITVLAMGLCATNLHAEEELIPQETTPSNQHINIAIKPCFPTRTLGIAESADHYYSSCKKSSNVIIIDQDLLELHQPLDVELDY